MIKPQDSESHQTTAIEENFVGVLNCGIRSPPVCGLMIVLT